MMRNLLLIPTVLLTGFSAMAQLYVAPNGSQDSYIYVNDNVVYVEDDINLTENTNDPTTQASIYLRNESQLVQGGGSTANTGTGYISVIQNSRSDAYDYNFWASPVGNPTGSDNQAFQMARVKDSLSITDSDNSTVIGSFNGSGSGNGGDPTLNPLRISRRWLYKWESGTYWQYVGPSGTVNPGYGFIMKGTNVTVHSNPDEDPNNQKYDFRGRPNKGTLSIAVPDTPDGVLSGNPYPSALDLNLLFDQNPDLDAVRFWDEDRSINSHLYVDNKGGYGAWIPDPGAPLTGNGIYTVPTFYNYDSAGNQGTSTGQNGQSVERRYSPIGQGFFMFTTTPGGATINLDDTQRTYQKEGAGNNSQFKEMVAGGNYDGARPNQGTSLTDSLGNQNEDEEEEETVPSTPSMHIYNVFSQGGEISHMRDLALVLVPHATKDYDQGMEAPHPMDAGGAEAFFRVTSEIPARRKLVIQSRPYDREDQIRLTLRLDEQMKVGITTGGSEVNLPGPMYVWDSEEDTYQQFTGGKTAVFILPQGTYENRFFLVYKGEREMQAVAEEFENEVRENIGVFQNNSISRLEVSNPEGYDIKQANIFDINGRLVLSEMNVGNSRRYSFPTGNMSDGVYIVKLTTSDNLELDYKIGVYNRR